MGERLSRQQERAIGFLLTARSFSEAAYKLEIHPNTLRHWAKLPEFAAAYSERARALKRPAA